MQVEGVQSWRCLRNVRHLKNGQQYPWISLLLLSSSPRCLQTPLLKYVLHEYSQSTSPDTCTPLMATCTAAYQQARHVLSAQFIRKPDKGKEMRNVTSAATSHSPVHWNQEAFLLPPLLTGTEVGGGHVTHPHFHPTSGDRGSGSEFSNVSTLQTILQGI